MSIVHYCLSNLAGFCWVLMAGRTLEVLGLCCITCSDIDLNDRFGPEVPTHFRANALDYGCPFQNSIHEN
jgi:hypothetical protein